MISLPAGSRIWLVAGITDMRNGFNGLASKVQNVLKDDLRIPLYSITDWHRSPISDSHPFDQPGT